MYADFISRPGNYLIRQPLAHIRVFRTTFASHMAALRRDRRVGPSLYFTWRPSLSTSVANGEAQPRGEGGSREVPREHGHLWDYRRQAESVYAPIFLDSTWLNIDPSGHHSYTPWDGLVRETSRLSQCAEVAQCRIERERCQNADRSPLGW